MDLKRSLPRLQSDRTLPSFCPAPSTSVRIQSGREIRFEHPIIELARERRQLFRECFE